MQVAAQVLYHARSTPDRPALGWAGVVATYGMIGRGVTTACAMLRLEKIPPGGIVAIEVGNPVHHIALILALELCGLTSLSVETRHAIRDAGLAVDALLIDQFSQPDASFRTILVADAWFAIAADVDGALTGGIPDDQYYRIILSSGTTGRPKAVGYKPPLIGRFLMRQAIMRSESAVRGVTMLGLSTIGFLGPIFALVQGGSTYFASTPDETLQVIQTFAVERLGYISVAHLEAMVAAARRAPDGYPSLRAVYVSGSKVPPGLAAEARARLCSNLIGVYASTEAGIMSYARLGATERIEGAAGHALPWVMMDTADADGIPLPPGREGLIRVKSPDMAEYVGVPGPIALSDWFHTGDIGSLRPDGMLVITGRSSEVINRGGIIVAPDYIERALEAHPQIREAAAFAVADAAGLERIWAAVVLSAPLDIAALRQAIRPTLGDKTPERIEVVDMLPRTATGKLKRGEMRERFTQRQAL